jgi:uncharacterized protein involved in exopolysaccharide biosynthesis
MVRLTAQSQDPAEAARIVNTWVVLFMDRADEIYGTHSEEEAQFFEEQLTLAQEELEATEQALVAFQAHNQGAILEAQLASARQDLQDYLVEQREIERAARNARALQASLVDQPEDAVASAGDSLTAIMLQVHTFSVRASRPTHMMDYEVSDGEYSVGEELPPIRLQVSDGSESEATSSIQVQISGEDLVSSEWTVSELAAFLDNLVLTLEAWDVEIEIQIAALEPQILVLQQQLQKSQAEGDRLTRARDVARETHLTLARKVAEARIAADDSSAEVQLASLAAVPEKPVGPRRMLNTAVAGMLGLMLGVFAVFALEWWRGDGETSTDEGDRDE